MLTDHKEKEDPWLGGRSPRLTTTQKKRIREFCYGRDGLQCDICGRSSESLEEIKAIHHRNGDPSNHSASNLCLVHHSCNSKAWNRSTWERHQITGPPKREKEELAAQSFSPEIRLNREYEPIFRRFCLEKVRLDKAGNKITRPTELRVEAREYIGCSSSTSYSYIERLFSPKGPLKVDEDISSGDIFVRLRDSEDYELSLEALEAKYPKKGSRFSTFRGATK